MKLNYQQAKEKAINQMVNDDRINEINNLKIKKDFKYGIGKFILNELEFTVLKYYLNFPKPLHPKISDNQIEKINRIVAEYAYNNFDFGRKKHTGIGDNLPLNINKGNLWHEESFEYGGKFKGWTNTKRLSGYAWTFHRTKPEILLRINDWNKPKKFTFYYLEKFFWEHQEYDLIPYELYYLLNSCVYFGDYIRVNGLNFKGLNLQWNENEHSFQFENQEYHVEKLWIKNSEKETFEHKIISALNERRRIDKKHQKEKEAEHKFFEKAHQVNVYRKDSLNAGNCQIQTDKFIQSLIKEYDFKGDMEDFYLTGNELLNYRDDQFTRRAVKKAIERNSL